MFHGFNCHAGGTLSICSRKGKWQNSYYLVKPAEGEVFLQRCGGARATIWSKCAAAGQSDS